MHVIARYLFRFERFFRVAVVQRRTSMKILIYGACLRHLTAGPMNPNCPIEHARLAQYVLSPLGSPSDLWRSSLLEVYSEAKFFSPLG